MVGEPLVEHVEQSFRFHGEAIDGVFDLHWCVGVEVAEASAEVGRAAHLPEQPGQAFGAGGGVGGEEGAELLGEIEQDGAGFEEADRLGAAAIHQGRDFGVGIDGDETAAELVAIADADQPGVVLGAAVAEGQQLFQHDGDLHAVGRGQRIELQRVAADREIFFVRGAGDGAVDVGEVAAAGLFPGPDLRGGVIGGVGHAGLQLLVLGRW